MIFESDFPLLLTIFVACFVDNGALIKCHVCNSKQDDKCVDPFNVSTTLQECTQGGRIAAAGKTLDVIEIIMLSLDAVGGAALPDTEIDADATTQHRQGVDESPLMVCQKIVVMVGNESITGRGCSPQLVDGMQPCDAVKLSAPDRAAKETPGVHVRHCVTCPYDACNQAPTMRPTTPVSTVKVVGLLAIALLVS